MKKRFLLALAALSFCGFVSAEEYWIIKDGQLNDKISQKPYTPDLTVFDTIIGGVEAPDGTACAKYVHNAAAYKDVRFDLSKDPLDLNKTWIMHIEYSIPTASDSVNYNTYAGYKEVSLNDGTKAAFRFGFDSELDSMNVDAMHGYCAIQGAVDAIESKGAWMTRDLYVFSTPSSQVINSFVMSYAREVLTNDISEEPVYIKNLSFVSGATKPFYAEDFSPMGISVTADGSGAEVAFAQEQWHGGIVPSKSADETKKLNLLCARVWDKPYDASKIFAAEINHAAKVVSKDVVLADIAIPEGYDCDKIQVRMLVKYCALGTATDDAAWALEDADRSYNISASFDNDLTLTQLNSDNLKGAWNWVTAKVDVPNGAKSISINFGKKVSFAYYVDQIYLEKPAECVVGVDEVNSDLTAVAVYPNPVTDVVYAAENASKMEVISLTGAVTASANGSSVNVSGLAAGTYIVKVYTTNGVATQTIIKK